MSRRRGDSDTMGDEVPRKLRPVRRLLIGAVALSLFTGLITDVIAGSVTASAGTGPAPCVTTPVSTTTCSVTLHLTSGTWAVHSGTATAFATTATAGFTATENPVTGRLRTGELTIPATHESNRGSTETIIFQQAPTTKATGEVTSKGQVTVKAQVQIVVHITKPVNLSCLSTPVTVDFQSATAYDPSTGDVEISDSTFAIPDFANAPHYTCTPALATLNKTFAGPTGNRITMTLHGGIVVPPTPTVRSVTSLSVAPAMPATTGGNVAGQAALLTATVVPGGSLGVVGSVQFKVTTADLGAPVNLVPGSGTNPATATMSTTALPVGTSHLTAVYGGYGKYLPSTSNPVIYQVLGPPTVNINFPSQITIGTTASPPGAEFSGIVSDPASNGPTLAHARLTFDLSGVQGLTEGATNLYVCTNPNYVTTCTKVTLTASTLTGNYGGPTPTSTFALIPGQQKVLYFHLYFAATANYGRLNMSISLSTSTSTSVSAKATLATQIGKINTAPSTGRVTEPISISLPVTPQTDKTTRQGYYEVFSASVTQTDTGPAPTGYVTLYRNLSGTATRTPLGSVLITTSNHTLTIHVTWPVGTYEITASYSGDTFYNPTTTLAVPLTLKVITPSPGVPYVCTMTLVGSAEYKFSAYVTAASSPTLPTSGVAGSTVSFGNVALKANVNVGAALTLVTPRPLSGLGLSLSPGGSAVGALAATGVIRAPYAPYGAAVDPKTHTAYFTNRATNSVSIVNETTDTVTGVVAVGSTPTGIAVDPTDGSTGTVYVTNTGSGTVSVIDAKTNTVTATIGVGTEPTGVAVDPKTHAVFVANSGSASVSVIDVNDTDTVTTVTLGVSADPTGIAVDPTTGSTGTAYLIYGGTVTRKLTTIDGATHAVTGTLIFTSTWSGSGKRAIGVNPRTDKVYIGSTRSLLVVSGGPGGPSDTRKISLPGSKHWGLAVDPTAGPAGVVYVAETASRGVISVVKGTASTVTKTVAVGSQPLGMALDSSVGTKGKLFVAAHTTMTISVIDVASSAVTDTIELSSGGMVIPTGNVLTAYVQAAAAGSVVLSSTPGNVSVGLSSWEWTVPFISGSNLSIICTPVTKPATIGTIDVLPPTAPTVSTQPASQTVDVGQTATFTAAATGVPAPTVQWQSSTNGTTWTDIAGATGTSYTTPATTGADNGTEYRAVFTNASGTAVTDPATLTVNVPPTVITQPTDQTVTAGTPTTFMAGASGRPTPTVQWQVSTNGGTSFTNIPGVTSTTLTFSPTAAQSGNQYRAVFTNSQGSATTTAATLKVTSTAYHLVGSDGSVFSFGTAQFYGSMGGVTLNKPVVGAASTPDGKGYWLVASDGGIFSFGDAQFYGSMGGQALNQPIVGMAATPTGKGYWEVASDGGIFSFGDAQFYGSMGGQPLNQPIVGMAATPTGKGYWEVASDGGIFAFGNATFYGSTGSMKLNQPIVGMAAAPGGKGYWLVASDGGIFAFGTAPFYGSTGGGGVSSAIVGVTATPDGKGYWLAGANGSVYAFGDAPLAGSAVGLVAKGASIVAMTG